MTTPRTPGTFWRIGDRVYRIDSAGRYRDVATDIPALLSLHGRPGVELRLVEVES